MQIRVYFRSTASNLHQRRCPNPGQRYTMILDFSSSSLPDNTGHRRQRRNDRPRITKRRIWPEDDGCKNTNIQIGCTSSDQSEMIFANTCDHDESKYRYQFCAITFCNFAKNRTIVCVIGDTREAKDDTCILAAYFCHGSWEEMSTWYTIASKPKADGVPGETFCFSMRLETVRDKATGRGDRQKQLKQELWHLNFSRTCQRNVEDKWTWRSYTLLRQGNLFRS